MEIHHDIKEQERKMISKCEEYSAGYNLLLQWISTRQEQLASPVFPKTAEETQRLLDRFKHQKVEEKENEKRKNQLGAMEQELTEFQRRHDKDFHLPQFAQLEMVHSMHVHDLINRNWHANNLLRIAIESTFIFSPEMVTVPIR